MDKIKIIIMDFDGTIADCRKIHYESLNLALESIDSKYVITEQEHISIYDGLSTKKKLQLLIENKSFPEKQIEQVSKLKQQYTLEMIPKCLSYNQLLINDLSKFKELGYQLFLASNAIRATVELGLKTLGIFDLFDKIYSNEDVINQKPHPQIYLKCMAEAGAKPSETLIIEDSKHGRQSAMDSKAHVHGVDSPEDFKFTKIIHTIHQIDLHPKPTKWKGQDLNILIPMSGRGSRFSDVGYQLPKPLIDVNGKPMIQKVIENLNIEANYIFIVQTEHYIKYNLGTILPLIAPNCTIVQTDTVTQGAACSSLLAKDFIDNDKHLLIVNSDQYVDGFDSCDFMWNAISQNVDGSIICFNKYNDDKWSYAKLDQHGYVTQVAEKQPISNLATIGFYYFKRGFEYVKAAERMIDKKIKFKNEYYICPVYNELIQDNKKIKTYMVDKDDFWGLGTPEDLEYFLQNYMEK